MTWLTGSFLVVVFAPLREAFCPDCLDKFSIKPVFSAQDNKKSPCRSGQRLVPVILLLNFL
ncbi:MAG: hypothetical protein ACL93V_11090 [Candidatus Electrothrix sp. YB6]